jgi:hypothetical protein
MKSIFAAASLACGLAVLTAASAHAQGTAPRQIQTLWQGSQAQVLQVHQGQWNDVKQALPYYQKMYCATDNQGHYLIGQVKNQKFEPWADIHPNQMKYDASQGALTFKGQMQQGPFKGGQVQGYFQQKGQTQIDAKLRVTQWSPKQLDYTVGLQMQLIWQQSDKPYTPNTPTTPTDPGTDKWGKGGDKTGDTSGDKWGKGGKPVDPKVGTTPAPPANDPIPPVIDPGTNGGDPPVLDPAPGGDTDPELPSGGSSGDGAIDLFN